MQDALEQAGIAMDADDEVEPALDTALYDAISITVYRVEYTERTVKETIAFPKETVRTSDLYKGQSQVTQQGVDGSRSVHNIVIRS